MQYTFFGNTGMNVSRLCLGTMTFGNQIDEAESARVLDEALDHGVNFIDTADSYGNSEEILGRILTKEKREKVFGLYEKLGITGVKIDFLNSDSQQRFRFRDAAIRDCLRRKLMVSFHGATVPRGQRRRWPHIATWEAVMGSEWYTLGPARQPNPRFNCTLPYTRNVLGPMDSCPVTFTAANKTTTNAHELALSVIYESGWQCISDTPEAYAASPGKPFLKQVHAAWDDIHFVDGYPGRFVCLARRKGDDWFLAAINGERKRTVSVPLDFLKPGAYDVTVYRDDAQSRDIVVKELKLRTDTPLKIALPAGGGFCTRIAQSHR